MDLPTMEPTLRWRWSSVRHDTFLRRALVLDAAVTATNGLAYLALGQVLDGPLGLSSALLQPLGALLLSFAVVVWCIASGPHLHTGAVRAVIALNVVWALESTIAVASGWLTPTSIGTVWVLLQAGTVAGFAALQLRGLRQRS